MPYKTVQEAEKKNKGLQKYSDKAKRGWLSAFNSSMEKDGDEQKAFAIAYSVANKVDGRKAASDDELARELLVVAREIVSDMRRRMDLAKKIWNMLPSSERFRPSRRALTEVSRKLGMEPDEVRSVLDDYNLGF